MSNQLQARYVNGTSKPNKSVKNMSTSVKIAIVVLSLAAIPLACHIPLGFQSGVFHARQRFAYQDFTTVHLFPNLDSFVYVGSNRFLYKREKVLRTGSITTFDPSMKILSRIMRILMENNAVIKAILLKKANLNHVRLSIHLDWLEKKSLIEYVVIDGKTHVTLTEAGREFAKPLVTLSV